MELVDRLRGRKVYFDTNVFIYAVEAVAEYAKAIGALFDLIETGEVAVFTSELALAETLAKPFETGRDDIARVYEEMLSSSSWLSVLSVERTILIEAARLQAGATAARRHSRCDRRGSRLRRAPLKRPENQSAGRHGAAPSGLPRNRKRNRDRPFRSGTSTRRPQCPADSPG